MNAQSEKNLKFLCSMCKGIDPHAPSLSAIKQLELPTFTKPKKVKNCVHGDIILLCVFVVSFNMQDTILCQYANNNNWTMLTEFRHCFKIGEISSGYWWTREVR